MTCDTAFRARGCLPSTGVEGLSTASICSNRKVSRPGVWTGDNESHGRNSELDHRAPRQREGSPALDQAPPRAPPLEPGRLHQARAPHAATGRRRRPAPLRAGIRPAGRPGAVQSPAVRAPVEKTWEGPGDLPARRWHHLLWGFGVLPSCVCLHGGRQDRTPTCPQRGWENCG